MSNLPRVTDVLAEVGIIDRSQYERYPQARDRGAAVHMACAYDDVGDLDESSLDPVIVPYLAGWRKFRREHVCVWSEIEQRLNHPIYGYTGQIDRRGTIDRCLSVADIKTGGKEDWHRIQLAAYAAFDRNYFKYNRLVIRLDGEGNYALDIYGPVMVADLNVFLSALTVCQYLRRLNDNRID